LERTNLPETAEEFEVPGIEEAIDVTLEKLENAKEYGSDTTQLEADLKKFEAELKKWTTGKQSDAITAPTENTMFCGICGEEFHDGDERAEIYDPGMPDLESRIVHSSCAEEAMESGFAIAKQGAFYRVEYMEIGERPKGGSLSVDPFIPGQPMEGEDSTIPSITLPGWSYGGIPRGRCHESGHGRRSR